MEWMTPNSSPRVPKYPNADVVLSTNKHNDKEVGAIRFYNNSEKQFAVNNRIAVAIVGYRMYFKGDEKGYLLSRNKRYGRSASIKMIVDSVTKFCDMHRGGYPLKFDVSKKLHYIDVWNDKEVFNGKEDN